jgi:hypothetical protein
MQSPFSLAAAAEFRNVPEQQLLVRDPGNQATRTTISPEKNQPAIPRHVCALPTSEEAVTVSG